MDMRLELAENIVITGGTAMLPGFLHRIQLELYDLLKQPRYSNILAIKKFKFHQPPAKANYTAWLGGKCKNIEMLKKYCNPHVLT